MSRSGYVDDMDDQWALIRWRGAVASSIRGRRGQSFLREMADALDALPEKKLVAMALEKDGCVCAIGAVGRARGIDMSSFDPEDYSRVAATFGIAEPLAQEIVWMNDEAFWWEEDENGKPIPEGSRFKPISPEGRFAQMRKWVASRLLPTEVQP